MTNASAEHRSEQWITSAVVPSFLIQLVIATIGAMIVGLVAALILSTLVAAITKNTSGGNFIDHVVAQPFLAWADLVIVFSAFALGTLARRVFRSRAAAFVWIFPAIILVWNLLTWEGAGTISTRTYWIDVLNNYFAHCGSSECLYKVFVTVPFYTSVAYSFGWAAGRFLGPMAHPFRMRL